MMVDINENGPNETPKDDETNSTGPQDEFDTSSETTEPRLAEPVPPETEDEVTEPEIGRTNGSVFDETPTENIPTDDHTEELQQASSQPDTESEPSIPKPFPEPDYPLSGPGNGAPTSKKKRAKKERKPMSPMAKAVSLAAVISLIVGGSAGAVVANLASPSSQQSATATTAPISSSNNSVTATPTDIQGILSKVEPAVVDIQTTGTINQGGIFGGSQQFQGAGTGMIITSNGEVLTNNHVIANASTIKVQLFNQTKLYNAVLVGTDPSHDVAVIKIQGVSKLPTVTFGKSASLQVGDPVIAVGNALALQGLPTVTQGIVSALNRSITTSPNGVSGGSTTLKSMIQTDAPINPGNSGGPLVNSGGQVVGMNTAIITGTGSEPAQNIGFAEAIDSVLPIVKQIEAHPNSSTGTITAAKAFLGVDIETMNSQIASQLGLPSSLKGAIVVDVIPGSPASKAGLTAGSVITKVDGTKIASASDLVNAIQKKSPGNRVTIYWTNSNGNGSAVITLSSAPTA